MELAQAVARRRMVRAFRPDPLPAEVVDRLIDQARRGPSAGNSQGTAFVVLSGPAETDRYWRAALPPALRSSFAWPGLLHAPVLVVVWCSSAAYVARYGEADKASTGLGAGPDAWPVPYWWVDAGAAVQTLLLGAVDAGLGACFFGLFDCEPSVAAALGVPEGWRAVGTVGLGHPAQDRSSRSVARGRRPWAEVVHRGRW